MNEFKEVTLEEFNAYIDDIKERLKKDAPEWSVVNQSSGAKWPLLYYHLARIDFSKGKDHTWPITLNSWIFAYEEKRGDDYPLKYYLLNLHPIS